MHINQLLAILLIDKFRLGCDRGRANQDLHRANDAAPADERDGDEGGGLLRHAVVDAGLQRMRKLRADV